MMSMCVVVMIMIHVWKEDPKGKVVGMDCVLLVGF